MCNSANMDISSMLEVQVDEVKETDSKENVTPKELNPSMPAVLQPISPEECNFYKLAFNNDISTVRFRRIHCTACDVHIGSAPSQAYNMFEHPVLRTLLCAKCREFYGDGTFEQGDDATDMFCRWCANGGNLYCCSYCSNTFCYKCIRRNFDSIVRKKIEADEKWKCFVCNPSDLYSTRAVCWALLQHVHTVTRLLQSDRTMPPEEVEERMNLDESECCPRRRKRKRRKTGSNSEDEDETYDPNASDEAVIMKRRSIKKRYRGSSSISKKQQDTTLPSQVNSIILETVNPPVVQTTLYNSTINAVPTVKLLQSTAAFKPMQSMLTPCIQSKNLYRPTYYSTTQMVTIPTQKHPLTVNKARVILPKPRKMVQMTVTPNVIQVDSDSDEPTVVPPLNLKNAHNTISNENTQTNSPSTIAVPVALVSTDKACTNDKIKKNETENEFMCKTPSNSGTNEKSFSQFVLLPHKEEFEDILNNLKGKFNQIIKDSQNEEVSRYNIQNTRSKIKNLYREICNTVTQLAFVNDRIVRKYCSWENLHNTKIVLTRDNTNRISTLQENNQISFDLTCANDSTDSENEESLFMLSPSKLIASTNVFDAFSKKRSMISHGVGNSSVLRKDKSIQVYSVESRDYEKAVGHSKINKTDHNPLTENSIVKRVTVSSKYFDKFQEQFIFYLQHIEDHGIETDDTSNSEVLESFPNVEEDSSITETISKEPSSAVLNNCSKSPENLEEKYIEGNENANDNKLPSSVSKSKTVSNIARIVETSASNDNVNSTMDKKCVKIISNTRSDQQNSNIEKETFVGKNSLVSNKGNFKENFCNVAAEDDCTIIEN